MHLFCIDLTSFLQIYVGTFLQIISSSCFKPLVELILTFTNSLFIKAKINSIGFESGDRAGRIDRAGGIDRAGDRAGGIDLAIVLVELIELAIELVRPLKLFYFLSPKR